MLSKKTNLQLNRSFLIWIHLDPQISFSGWDQRYLSQTSRLSWATRDYGQSSGWSHRWFPTNVLTAGNQRGLSPVWSGRRTKCISNQINKTINMKLFVLYLDSESFPVALTNSANAPGSVIPGHLMDKLAFIQFVPKARKSMLTIPGKPQVPSGMSRR